MSMALRSLLDDLHEQLAERGFEVRPVFAFVLLESRKRALTANEIAQLLGVTKQAASKLVDTMEAEQLLTRRPDPKDARAKLLHIAPKGRRLLEAAEQIYAELEANWATVIGKGRLEALRSDLNEVLCTTHGGELPPIRPLW
jgi:DNA-binding MarR family transcriptional regulator